MTLEEFKATLAKSLQARIDAGRYVLLPCTCGFSICRGFTVQPNEAWAVERHQAGEERRAALASKVKP